MSTPSVHPVRGGFDAMCGKCLRRSAAVAAASPADAGVALVGVGWTLHNNCALCPTCTVHPPNVDKDAARAIKGKHR